ncbi:MAG: hypothetical protein WDO70_07260 [Alphaproteobacteria bacterium]
MPSSGYSPEQLKLVEQFLESCATAMDKECALRGDTLINGLRRERFDIETFILQNKLNESQIGVLELTVDFYRKVENILVAGEKNYAKAVRAGLDSVSDDIRLIITEQDEEEDQADHDASAASRAVAS